VAMMSQYNIPDNVRWICLGGSYSGALSAWFRLKYPHLVHAAVASSAPVFPVLDFTQYMDVVTQSLTSMSGDDNCINSIENAVSSVSSLLTSAAGRATLSSLFNTCSPLTDDQDDITNFVSTLASNFSGCCSIQ